MTLALFITVFLTTTILVSVVMAVLNKKGILDTPRVQSSHVAPTPRGGGLGVMPVIFASWIFLTLTQHAPWPNPATFWSVIVCGIMLCSFTWLDDYKPGGLRVRTRLVVQLLAVVIPVALWPADAERLLPDAFPLLLERLLMALAWLWFCNLYNFMDGINGISGAEAISISGGLVLFCLFAPVFFPEGYVDFAIVIMAAAAGFLVWNARPVARIFLGDVGSVGFGYCLAWLLFVFAAQGYLTPAILVSLVYCMDATCTLLKRAWQKKKIWEAHREHYYHRATVSGALTHLQCVAIILCVNATLIGLGFLSLDGVLMPLAAITCGFIIVTALLVYFYVLGKNAGHVSSPRPKPFRIERLIKVFLKRRI